MKQRTAAVAMAALIGLVAGPFLTATVGAGPVAISTVYVFNNDTYVDSDQEVPNLIDDLEAGGHTVVEFEDISDESWVTVTEAAEVIVIPELERKANIELDLSDAAIATITDWVDGGGRLLWFGDEGEAEEGLNAIFGFAVDEYGDETCGVGDEFSDVGAAVAEGDACPLTAEGGNTEWADGPSPLGYVNHTTGLVISTLPAGSTVVYQGAADDVFDGPEADAAGDEPEPEPVLADTAALVSMPYGDGVVVYHGWDWYPEQDEADADAATVQEESDWAVVLDFSVSQPEVTADSPAPGVLRLTMDSPSTQPVFVALVINGTTHTVPIAPKTTFANFDVAGGTVVAWSVPGWGIGEGSTEVAAGTAAQPVPAAPTFTG